MKNISSQNNSDNSNSNSNSNNSGSNFNNNLILNPINEGRENILKLNGVYDGNNSLNNVNNNNDPSKKNLYELFNNAKNDLFLSDTKKQINNINNNINLPNNSINNRIDLIKKKNVNLQISPQFMFSSPRNIKKSKKIFECSGSTNNSSNKIIYKKRRFRKNNDQLSLLKKFYEENKTWSKSQIKEISLKISLKENKVYKWLWDQKNKEIKANKFVVKKGDNE